MPLANVVPHVVLHQKTHVLVSENFFGRWKWVAAPCEVVAWAFKNCLGNEVFLSPLFAHCSKITFIGLILVVNKQFFAISKGLATIT